MAVRTRAVLESLPAYAPGRTIPGAVKLASNELPFPTLPAVLEAIEAAGAAGATGINRYPDISSASLAEVLADRAGTTTDRIAIGGGSVALCQQLVQIVAAEGDEVLFGWRSFEAYPIVTQITGAVPVRVPVDAEHRLDLDAMVAAVTPATKLVFLCTPNNPTGTVLGADELEAFLDRVPDDLLVVVDEAYREFDTDPASADGARIADHRDNVIALRTLSKAYGLAGLRVGYAVGDPELIVALRKVQIPFSVNMLAQAAALVALDQIEDLRPRWQVVIDERARVTAALRGFGFDVPTSQANFVWLPFEERSAAFAAHCEEQRVITRPFSHPAGGGVRVTIGTPEENDQFLAAAGTWRPA